MGVDTSNKVIYTKSIGALTPGSLNGSYCPGPGPPLPKRKAEGHFYVGFLKYEAIRNLSTPSGSGMLVHCRITPEKKKYTFICSLYTSLAYEQAHRAFSIQECIVMFAK